MESENITLDDLTSDFPAEREENFFSGPDSFRFGPFSCRLYFEVDKYRWVVCLRRKMKVTDTSEGSDSFLKFAAQDIPFVIKTIKDFIHDIRDCSNCLLPPLRDKFVDEDASYKNAEYWNRYFCKSTPGKSLIIRPYKDLNGSYFIRMLVPKDTKFKNHWQGVSSSFTVPQALYLIGLLERFQPYILECDAKNSSAEEGLSVCPSRPSPTSDDLDKCAGVEVMWMKPGKRDK